MTITQKEGKRKKNKNGEFYNINHKLYPKGGQHAANNNKVQNHHI